MYKNKETIEDCKKLYDRVLNEYKNSWEALFNCDGIHEVFCKNCGKKWIHMEASPGDEYYFNYENEPAKEFTVENSKEEFSPFKFIVCTCNFPLMIEYHSDHEWETQDCRYFVKAQFIKGISVVEIPTYVEEN